MRSPLGYYLGRSFRRSVAYLEQYGGVAIAETQIHRLKALVENSKIKNILIFPIGGDPEKAAALFQSQTP